jgi:uncharacterized membrane protein YcaP (DUF421 family)
VAPLVSQLAALAGDPLTIVFTALRVAAVYAIVLVALRLGGRRLLGQVTPFDLVSLLLLANAAQNAMIGPDLSLTGGVVGIAVLIASNRLIAGSAWARGRIEGHPVLLVHRGRTLPANLTAEHVSVEELETAMREHGVADVGHVETAVLEMDGTISVIGTSGSQVHRLKKVRSTRNR